jgi:drug/metabolite transporter (DMT)-like permease
MAPGKNRVKRGRIFILTSAAMVAFAANSLFCRLALRSVSIDPASFSFVRIAAGAATLWIVFKIRHRNSILGGSWTSAAALFAYVAAFSFAYTSLPAGTGALLLFFAVQCTMIGWGWLKGERLHIQQWIGIIAASAGLVLLMLPGISAPPLVGSLCMIAAGIGWGAYSLRGRGAPDPIAATAGNFIRAAPMAGILLVLCLHSARANPIGISYAVASGAITSGLGYVVWYAALGGLTATSAATVQLSAPVLAAIGGILFLDESVSFRFVAASIAILGGIALVVTRRAESRLGR